MFEVDSLARKTFVDVGSGSGLFSLAARSLGAKVYSFDFDPSSVWCTRELRRRYHPEDGDWTVEQGSALDSDYVHKLGKFDLVYSWGVLHHTGDMWKGLDLVADLVKPGGMLFIALYNDQGRKSRLWTKVKKAYCRLPRPLKPFILLPSALVMWGPRTLLDCLTLKPFASWRHYYRRRGMSPWRDIVDWVGGYPFETAKPETIFEFYRKKGFVLQRMKTTPSLGNNEFVFNLPA
jgi:2-polyprenyl-6-hydroxyphenyl methylase/3-demethylubiquinone-9 3-methyltransferase